MIIGIGLDLIEVKRFLGKEKDTVFLNKLFSEREQQLFKERKFNPQVIAGNFAGKEAVMKAFETGFCSGFEREIEILREPSGKPFVNLNGKAKSAFEELGGTTIFISLTNTQTHACAQVIIEK